MITDSLSELLAEHRAGTLGLVRVCCPAVVQSYDTSTLSVVVKLTAPVLVKDPDTGRLSAEPLPPIRVPVAFPHSGTAGLTYPIAEGSAGLVLFADRPTDAWRRTASVDAPPADARRMDLVDGHFLPVSHGSLTLLPDVIANAATGAVVLQGEEVRLGNRGEGSGVAKDDRVEAELQDLWDAVARLNAAIPGGTPDGTLPVWPATQAPGSVGSTIVKVN